MPAKTSTQRTQRRYQKLNEIAQQNGFDTWQKLTTAAMNGKAVIVTQDRIFETLVHLRDGSIDFGDGLQGLVYATLWDVAKHLGLSDEQARIVANDGPSTE
jgi:hypothetical protein